MTSRSFAEAICGIAHAVCLPSASRANSRFRQKRAEEAMKMTGQQRIAAPPARVWDALQDPAVLKACIPGCESLEPEGEDRMRAVVAIKIGPISAKFAGAVALTEKDPPKSCLISGEGHGGNAGVAKGEARVRLEADGGATLLSYDVDAKVGGRLVQVGGALIDATAKRLAGGFFDKFAAMVEGPPAAVAPAASEPAPAAPAPELRPAFVPTASPRSGRAAAWLLAVALAALVGFLAGRGQGGAGGSDWMGIAFGLLLLVVGAAGFFAGRGTSAPTVMVDAAQLVRALQERDR
jgi:carbon monoxide dehydrogenase subunit G